MKTTPKSLRLHIALVGRANVGKSTFLNLVAGQDVAITSCTPGTTTDVVEKAMELLPIGPVVFLDTAGIDDATALGEQRVRRTHQACKRADVIVLVCEAGRCGDWETSVMREAETRGVPVIAIANKIDCAEPLPDLAGRLGAPCCAVIPCNAADVTARDAVVAAFKSALISACPESFLQPPPLVGDLLPPGGLAVLIVPIDLQAPKGRLILPQVQTIRDALDNDSAVLVVKEREYAHWLATLGRAPDLVVCDSQVVMKMVADTPPAVACTTFSILFARLKGDLQAFAAGAAAVEALRDGDRVLIAESCSHHAMEDDIGRVKIPRWLRQYTGATLTIDTFAGRDFPEDLSSYRLVIQCGGCMTNRREMLARLEAARAAGVPITNYGLCISVTQGVIRRVLSPFPAAADAYGRTLRTNKQKER